MAFHFKYEVGDEVITINYQKIQLGRISRANGDSQYVDIRFKNGYSRSFHKYLVLPYDEMKRLKIPYETIYCYLHLAEILSSNGYDIQNSLRYFYDRICLRNPRICYSKKKLEFIDKIEKSISDAVIMFNDDIIEVINTFCYNNSVRDKYAEFYNLITERLNKQNG